MTGNLRAQAKFTENAILIAGILMILGPGAVMLLNIQITERFFGAKDVLSQSPIGEISKPRKVVRKKGEEDSAYLKARQGDPVFEGDTVLTGKESATKVTLSDGTVLELGPESMIRIEPVRSFSFRGIQKKFEVTVETGAIKAKAKAQSAPVVLKSKEGQVLKEIASSKPAKRSEGILPALTRSLPLPLPKLAPSSAPKKPAGAPTPITGGIAGTGSSRPGMEPLLEPPEEDLFEEEEAVVSVPPAPAAAPPPAAISKPVAVMPPGMKPGAVPAPAAPPVSAPAPSSLSRIAGIDEKDLLPDAEEMLEVPEIEEKPILSKPVLAMAPKPKPLVSVPAPSLPLPSLPSAALSTPTPTPVPLATATPMPSPKVAAGPSVSPPAAIVLEPAQLQERRFLLRWKDLRKDPKMQYKVSVVHEGRTSNIIASELETTWTLPAKKEGSMEWFVEALNADGSFSKSNTRKETWKVSQVVSSELVPSGSEILGEKIRLSWQDRRKKPRGPYKVSIVHGGKTDTVISAANDALWAIPLEKSGKIEWFVEAPDDAEGLIKSATLATSWKFQTPTLKFPKPDADLPDYFLKGDRHELLITWAPLESCKEYRLNISASPKFETLLYTKITARNIQRFPVEKPGEYFWRVGCAYGEAFTVYSAPRRFTVQALNQTRTKPKPAAIKTPAASGTPATSATPGPSATPAAR